MPDSKIGLHSPADCILHNGKVITVDANDSIKQAVAISGEKIQAVGPDSEVLALKGQDTTTMDLQGRTVIPGIIDIHAHMDREGLKSIFPSLEGARSIDDILSLVRSEVESKQPGEWVVTMPIGDPPNFADMPESLREGRWPTRWELDKVSPLNPVYIRGIWTPWTATHGRGSCGPTTAPSWARTRTTRSAPAKPRIRAGRPISIT